MTNVYMTSLYNQINQMGMPQALNGNTLNGSCFTQQSFPDFSAPANGLGLSESCFSVPMTEFGGLGLPSSFTLDTTTTIFPTTFTSQPNLDSFGSFTMPTFSMPTFNFSMNFALPKLNFSNSFRVSSSDTVYTSFSKIKPGLLKGNLKGKENVVTQLCQKYKVDIGLALTIIGQESGFGTSKLAEHNNFMGYRAAGDAGKSERGFGYFSTPEKGLEAAIKNLSQYPKRYASVKKADMNNIDAIGKIYCEGNSYASSIKNLYDKTVKRYLA